MTEQERIGLTVATWNVLAAPWAAPSFYPRDMDSSVLDRHARTGLVATAFAALGADVVCLQETTPPDLTALLARLDGWDHSATTNARDLWSQWSTAELAWEPNGTAIIWRADRFADVTTGALPLSADGNVATWLRARHRPTGTTVRAMSVHLDADDPARRREQLPVALQFFPVEAGVVDVIAGDCNEDTIDTDLTTLIDGAGYDDALTRLGCLDPTHPYARPEDDYAPIARLDHVLIRGAVPVSGAVIDSGVWTVEDPGARMERHLALTGSDHLPVVMRVEI